MLAGGLVEAMGIWKRHMPVDSCLRQTFQSLWLVYAKFASFFLKNNYDIFCQRNALTSLEVFWHITSTDSIHSFSTRAESSSSLDTERMFSNWLLCFHLCQTSADPHKFLNDIKPFDSGRGADARSSASSSDCCWYFCQLVLPVWQGVSHESFVPLLVPPICWTDWCLGVDCNLSTEPLWLIRCRGLSQQWPSPAGKDSWFWASIIHPS